MTVVYCCFFFSDPFGLEGIIEMAICCHSNRDRNRPGFDATTTTLLHGRIDPVLQITRLLYMHWVHWSLDFTILAVSMPFRDVVLCVAHYCPQRPLFAATSLQRVFIKRADESISTWLTFVIWSLVRTNNVDRSVEPLFVAILLALFMLPDDDENSFSLLMTWNYGQTGQS